MKRIIFFLAMILTIGVYAQPQNDLINLQRMYMYHATATVDTIDMSGWKYYKFSIAPVETDSILQFSFNGFDEGDSVSITQPQVFNQPDWLDALVYDELLITGAGDYILIIYGKRKP